MLRIGPSEGPERVVCGRPREGPKGRFEACTNLRSVYYGFGPPGDLPPGIASVPEMPHRAATRDP